jgi:hypothetical protein
VAIALAGKSSALPWFTAEANYAGHVGISIEINEAVESSL